MIHATDNTFQFDNIKLSKPVSMPGGTHFIKSTIEGAPLYFQPPKCTAKSGFIKSGKKYYVDLLFSHDNDCFVEWMEHLENYCLQYISKNSSEWFEDSMNIHDIENYFTSPLKVYRSGKFYVVRVGIHTSLGNPILKIYNENEEEVSIDDVQNDQQMMTILEFKGIKCSSTSFQFLIEMKQVLLVETTNIFEKCVIKRSATAQHLQAASLPITEELIVDTPVEDTIDNPASFIIDANVEDTHVEEPVTVEEPVIVEEPVTVEEPVIVEEPVTVEEPVITEEPVIAVEEPPIQLETVNSELQEIELCLDNTDDNEPVSLRKRNDVYYEMYREARRKAKVARDLALSSYIEAKRIKNAYLLKDIEDSESDEESFMQSIEDNE